MMTLWSMMRSPLMIGGEMTKNDAFTLKLLTNGEVLRIGKESWCGHPLRRDERESVWVAPRQDGDGGGRALVEDRKRPSGSGGGGKQEVFPRAGEGNFPLGVASGKTSFGVSD